MSFWWLFLIVPSCVLGGAFIMLCIVMWLFKDMEVWR
jgi:hypothetical protein